MLSRDHLPAAEVAAHLLEATPDGDPWVVDTLRAAAATARGEGAPHLSARYLRRALEEPPLPEQRAGVLFELGIAEARDDLAAVGHLRESLALEAVPARRAEIGLLLGRTLGLAGHHGEAVDVLARARNEDGIDPELERWVEAELVGHCLHTADKLGLGFERITQAIANGRSGTSPAEKLVQVIATFAAISSAAITPDAAVRVARAAAAEPVVAHDENSSLRFFIAETLVFADAADRAVAVLDEMITEARARASMPGVALASTFRAQALLRRGDVLGAEADARTALEVVDSQILGYCRPYVLSFLIDVLVERGELEEAERLVEAEGPDAEWPELWQCGLLLGSRGRLRIAQSRIEDGVGDLLEWGRRIAPWRPRNPSAAAWRSEAAVGLAMLGRIDEAAYLAEWELRHARAMGPGRGLGVALRAAGLVEGGENGVALLRQAVDVLDRADADLESARALTDLGAMLRRQGSRVAAREPLRRGLDLATRCGATVLAGRARDELVAAGARPRRDALRGREALTPRELSAARLAAEGMSNREIAQALFVTLRTVELHLSNAYGKLNIQSRQELPDVLRPSSLVRTQSA
jgi:DNA-binding CsgD family transcriptional regulator